MLKNPAVDEVQEVRQRLIKQHGGLKGYVEYLQQLDAKDAAKKPRRSKPAPKPKSVRKIKYLTNPVVEEVQEIRQRLIRQYGGFDGYFEHLLEFQKTLDQNKMV